MDIQSLQMMMQAPQREVAGRQIDNDVAAVSEVAQVQQAERVDPKMIQQEVEKLNEVLKQSPLNMQVKLDEQAGQKVMTMMDGEGRSISQYPSEQVLQVSRAITEKLTQDEVPMNMQDMNQGSSAGMLIDQRA